MVGRGARTRGCAGGQRQYQYPPLVMCNGFGREGGVVCEEDEEGSVPTRREEKKKWVSGSRLRPELALTLEMLQSMVPEPMVERRSDLSHIHRVVLFHLMKPGEVERVEGGKEEGEEGRGKEKTPVVLEMRHYTVQSRPTGLNRSIAKLSGGNVPESFSYAESLSEALSAGPGGASDTEGEGENVELPPALTFRRQKGSLRVKLVELGPRLSLRLLKVESGVCGGEVIWHSYLSKTPAEVALLEEKARHTRRENKRRAREREKQKAEKDGKGVDKKRETTKRSAPSFEESPAP